jgi:hypothetical protein
MIMCVCVCEEEEGLKSVLGMRGGVSTLYPNATTSHTHPPKERVREKSGKEGREGASITQCSRLSLLFSHANHTHQY